MINSAARYTSSFTCIEPNCQSKWSESVVALERKFSNDGRAHARIQIIAEEASKVDFFERILLFGRLGWLFECGCGAFTILLLLAGGNFVQQGNGIFQFLKHWIFS